MVFPVIIAMLIFPPAYSASSAAPSVVYYLEAYRDASTEDINPSLEGGAGEFEEDTNTHNAVLREALRSVCSCESTGSPYKVPQQFHVDGSVVKGLVNPKDIGQCQINLHYWGAEAVELGHDIYTSGGNIEMANHIYDNLGLEPWSASQLCWAPALQALNPNESNT